VTHVQGLRPKGAGRPRGQPHKHAAADYGPVRGGHSEKVSSAWPSIDLPAYLLALGIYLWREAEAGHTVEPSWC
jgi:hypothetical protein